MKKIILLMLFSGAVFVASAQAPKILQTFKFTGYNYPQDPGGSGTLLSLSYGYTLYIGSSTNGAFDMWENTGADGSSGGGGSSNGTFAANFNLNNNDYASVDLNTSSYYCDFCDGRAGNITGTGYSADYGTGWDFTNDPLGQRIVIDNADFHVEYLIQIPTPALNLSSGASGSCSGDVTASVAISWANLNGLTYDFEYSTDGLNYSVLDQTSSPSINLGNYSVITNYLNSRGATSTIYMRVKVIGANYTTTYGTGSISVSPPAPTVGPISVTAACSAADGVIQLNSVTGLGTFAFVLQNVKNGPLDCDPRNPSSCNTVEASGSFSSSQLPYAIGNVAPGNYLLLVSNDGGGSGACHQTIPVTVNGIPALNQGVVSHTNVSCPGGSDGSISVTSSGGGPPITYQLVNITTGSSGAPQSAGNFAGLAAGSYRVDVYGSCGLGFSAPFVLTQPTAVTGNFVKTDATCTSPGDGTMTATVSQGSGTYNYYLYLGGTLAASQTGSSNTSWGVGGLAPGSYSLQVYDAATSGCSGYTATVTIGGPPALGLSVVQQTALSCNGVSTGSMQLQGSGAMGTYVYTITETGSGQSYSNTTGMFGALPAGSYTAVVQSGVAGCTDQYLYPQPIVLSQPPVISANLSATDVRCFGEGNGSVVATVGGGTGALALVWQQKTGGVWTATGQTGGSLSGLSPGIYRLSISDANNCQAVSAAATIAEPALLTIGSVGMTDIVCYGGTGTITPVATGGNGGNVWESTGDGGSSYSAFQPGDAFGVGSYQVRVTDSKGCRASWGASQVITAPAAPLSFTDALSDYNGYNVSCYGALTGVVTVSATGGNGAAYNGYTYSVDGGSWLGAPVLNALPGGAHVVRVSDGRGCVVQHTETLTQPASELTESLAGSMDNDCVDGVKGVLTVGVTGGTQPYAYSKDGTSLQSGPSFTGLASGNYTLTVIDANGCRQTGNYTVRSLYPAMDVQQAIGDVQCNGGSDGSVTLSVSGGYGAYTYQWSVAGGSGNQLQHVPAGVYTVHITDEKGCGAGDTATINQPQPLSAGLVVRPVCSDATSGRVGVTASGGTPPYRYASDNSSGGSDSLFNDLGAGAHTIWVTDSHGCSWSKPVTITVQPLVPVVNFLVSTQQNALDTLQVEDVSSPKPDSVQWSFAPSTLLLGASPQGPLIRYASPGTYPAAMRAWYGGCDFSVSQSILIQPYDSNSTSPMVLAGLSIDTARLSPNPCSGTFNIYVKLYKAQRLALTVTSLSGQSVFRKQWDGQQLVSEPVSLPSSVVSGAYIVELVTETEIRDYNLIVTK